MADRFFGKKSDFDRVGKDFGMEKSGVKKLEKNHRFFPDKIPIFSEKTLFFLKKKNSDFFSDSKNMKTLLLTGFEPTQNGWKWHNPTTKPSIALIIYNANFFYILLLFICS